MRIRISKKRFVIFSLIIVSAICLGSFCLAQKPLEINYPEVPGAETPTTTAIGLPSFVKYIFNFSLGLAVLIAFLSTVLGGFCYLTSAGSPKKQRECKDQILAGILGLIILFSSYSVLATVNPQLLIFHLPALEEIVLPVATTTIPIEEEKTFTYFQIPTGQIIDDFLSSAITTTYYDYTPDCINQGLITKNLFLPEAANKLALELKCKSKELDDLIKDIKKEIDACRCGKSSCDPDSAFCPPFMSQKCGGYCNVPAIQSIATQIKAKTNEIKALRQKPVSITSVREELAFHLLQIKKAGFLMSAPFDVRDYDTMLNIRQELEKYDSIVKYIPSETSPDTDFPNWEDILLKTGSADPASFYFYKTDQSQGIIDQAKKIGL